MLWRQDLKKSCHLASNWWPFYVSLLNSWNYRPWSPVLEGSLIFERRAVIIHCRDSERGQQEKACEKRAWGKESGWPTEKHWDICCDDIAQGEEEQRKGWSSQASPRCPKELDLTLVQQGSSLILHVFHKTKQDVVGQLPDQCMSNSLSLVDHARDTWEVKIHTCIVQNWVLVMSGPTQEIKLPILLFRNL